MQKQKTILPDGRYLIYYTFAKPVSNAAAGKKTDTQYSILNTKSAGDAGQAGGAD